MPRFEREDACFLLFLVLFLMAETAVLLQPASRLGPLYLDDAYYNFQVARNLAAGLGLTFDGTASTNGVHPLVVLFCLPFHWLFPDDRWMALRGYGALLLAVYSLIGWLLWRWGRGNWPLGARILLIALWFGSKYFRDHGLRGGDALWVTLIAVQAIRCSRDEQTRPITVGLWLAAAILARWDCLPLWGGVLLERWWRGERRQGAMIRMALPGLLVLAVMAVANQIWFGHPAPGNGRAVRMLAESFSWYQDRHGWMNRLLTGPEIAHIGFPVDFSTAPLLRHSLVAFVGFLAGIADALIADPWFAEPNDLRVLPRMQECFVLLVAGIWLLRHRSALGRVTRLPGVPALLLFSAGLAAIHVFYVHAHWSFARYFYPAVVLAVLLVTDALAEAAVRGRWTIALAALYFGFSVIQPSGAIGYKMIHSTDKIPRWIETNLPVNARVGSFQAGYMAYASGRTVIDLDGKANQASLEAFKSQRMDRFLFEHRIEYLIDMPFIINYSLLLRTDPPNVLRLEPVHWFPGFWEIGVYRVIWQDAPAP